MEHAKIEHDISKIHTPPDDTDRTHATPPHPKKRYEFMKDPVFFPRQSILLSHLRNLHFLQIVMII